MASAPTTGTQVSSSGQELRRHRDPIGDGWIVHVAQGDAYVSDEPNEIITTVLGSCIAACMRDPFLGIGGMNHFLLPEGGERDRLATRYGVNAMEVLINGILSRGGSRSRLEAKLFGGANVMSSLSDIGARNVAFAKQFLDDENIKFAGGDVGGSLPRRIQYWPQSGRARQMTVISDTRQVFESELRVGRETSTQRERSGNDVELF